MKHGDERLAVKIGGIGRIDPKGLGSLMRERWRTVNGLWEVNKARANRLDLLGRLDYHGELSTQFEWQGSHSGGPVRVVYTDAGTPTATFLTDDAALVDSSLYWMICRDETEALYLLAIINSDALYEAAKPLMPKGQFGARHLHKHLWKLPIPAFDDSESLHKAISEAGDAAGKGAENVLEKLRGEREKVTVTVARREIRGWLRSSREGKEVEGLVGRLLG